MGSPTIPTDKLILEIIPQRWLDIYMTKYKQYVDRMLESEKELFAEFSQIHAKYSLDEDKYQEEFNKIGEKVLIVVAEWENKLCRQSEKAGYGSFTSNLSEKFRQELKRIFPLIDHIGIIVRPFTLKKIRLE